MGWKGIAEAVWRCLGNIAIGYCVYTAFEKVKRS